MDYSNINFLAHSSFYLIFIVLIIGARHGFDLDHLAAIDAMTRTVRNDIKISKFTGLLFSLGHGLVVTLLSGIIGSGLIQFKLSHHFEVFGNLISIVFLIAFGILNFCSIFKKSAKLSDKINIKKSVLNYINGKHYKSIAILGVGAIFAISFDTFSQITLFSLSASAMGGFYFSFLIGIVFMIGMIIADGLNGLLVSYIICKTNKASLIISRSMGAAVALFSLTTGAFGLICLIN